MKATHYGHCQVCNRRQKLPNGKLAKHGYQILGGYFDGVCFGSEHLPIEQDKTLVVESQEWAAKKYLAAKLDQIKYDQPATELKTWRHIYKTYFGSGYVWEYIPVKIEPINNRPEFTMVYGFFGDGNIPMWHPMNKYNMFAKTEQELLDRCTENNRNYVCQYLQPMMRDLNRYCLDQQRVLDTWHQKPPLVPIQK